MITFTVNKDIKALFDSIPANYDELSSAEKNIIVNKMLEGTNIKSVHEDYWDSNCNSNGVDIQSIIDNTISDKTTSDRCEEIERAVDFPVLIEDFWHAWRTIAVYDGVNLVRVVELAIIGNDRALKRLQELIDKYNAEINLSDTLGGIALDLGAVNEYSFKETGYKLFNVNEELAAAVDRAKKFKALYNRLKTKDDPTYEEFAIFQAFGYWPV